MQTNHGSMRVNTVDYDTAAADAYLYTRQIKELIKNEGSYPCTSRYLSMYSCAFSTRAQQQHLRPMCLASATTWATFDRDRTP